MAVNKVVFGTTTIVDLTDTTATADKVFEGYDFYDASGVKQSGTATGGGSISIYQDQDGYVVLDDEGGSTLAVTPLSVTANGRYTAPTGVAYSPVTVNVSGGGAAGGQIGKDVVFLDYDGTEVASYDDITDLTALPANPSHTGLTAQGWNWTLQEITAQHTAYPDQTIYVGQLYTTDTGDTRLYIHIDEDTPDSRLTFYVRFTSSTTNNVTLDWGDGVTEATGSTTVTNYEHTYATGGDYVIKLTVNTGTISFAGSSSYTIYGSTATSNTVNRGRIRKVEIGNNVTGIGDYTFYYCYSLKTITIPSNVMHIGSSAFQYCHSLTSITIPSNVVSIWGSAFSSCYSLTSIAIPSSVTSIKSNAFHNCNSLIGITIPSSVISIENQAFGGCYSITNITIPSGVTSIGSSAFASCTSITNITIPSSVTSIGSSAFQNCNSLTSITIPNNVTSIENQVFSGCNSLTSIIIPSGVISIGSNAFYNCFSLTSITIPSGVTSIGANAFYGCNSLTTITIPSGVTSIATYAFQNCFSLTNITIPSGVTSIGTSAFYGCYCITSITIPSNVTTMGNNVFQYCYSLTSIVIPSGVTSIGNNMFNSCYSLTSLTIPSSVTSIGTSAFASCYGVSEYHFEPTTPPTITNVNVFTGFRSDCKIYVPYSEDHSILEAYQTADYWSTYASYMVEESA